LALTPGTRIGAYEIGRPLGAGGMGEVYQATDTVLGRQVAVKVLPPVFAQDPEHLARFEREAKVLATLNHANIAQIHGLERANGQAALVMELVDGPTLADRIAEGALAFEAALPIATQVAHALEAAHDAGIVHRDLKPANIKVRPDGMVKVLDFGLAKAVESSAATAANMSQLPTVTTPAPLREGYGGQAMTQAGMILGTAAYMAPEQARGKPVDARADVWAFGCVLFEMLTGRRAFQGEDVTDTLAAVVRAEPPWELLPADTPHLVRLALQQCLQKQPTQRLRDVGAVRLLLEEAARPPEPHASTGATAKVRSVWMWATAAAVIAAAATGAATWALSARRAAPAPSLAHLSINLDSVDYLGRYAGASYRPSRTAFAVTADGRTIVFSATRGTTTQLFRRSLDDGTTTSLAGTEGAIGPFLSPDGNTVAFWADGAIKKTPVGGGPVVAVCDAPAGAGAFGYFGGSWGAHDTIAFSAGAGVVFTVPAAGGTPKAITSLEAGSNESQHVLPTWLPDERGILFTARNGTDMNSSDVVLQPLPEGERRILVKGAADARYLGSGHLLYLTRGTLMGAAFDPEAIALTGEPVALLDNVMQAVNAYNGGAETGAGQFAVAAAGTLVYVPGGIHPEQTTSMAWVDRQGRETALKEAPGPISHPRISPDGSRVAFVRNRKESRDRDVWLHDVQRGTLDLRSRRLRGAGVVARWSPTAHPAAPGTALDGVGGWADRDRRRGGRRCDTAVVLDAFRRLGHARQELEGWTQFGVGRPTRSRRPRAGGSRAPLAELPLSVPVAGHTVARLQLGRVRSRGGVRATVPRTGCQGSAIGRRW
jgi:serine/threonine-protein kinase